MLKGLALVLIFCLVSSITCTITHIAAAGQGDAVFRAVHQRVVDAEVVGSANQTGQVPLNFTWRAGAVLPGVSGARAISPEAWQAEAFLNCARAGIT